MEWPRSALTNRGLSLSNDEVVSQLESDSRDLCPDGAFAGSSAESQTKSRPPPSPPPNPNPTDPPIVEGQNRNHPIKLEFRESELEHTDR